MPDSFFRSREEGQPDCPAGKPNKGGGETQSRPQQKAGQNDRK